MGRTRRAVVAHAAVGLLATSGCTGLLSGDELSFEASPASVRRAALSETGYERARADTRTLTREFTVAGETRTVEVTNHVAEYEREADLGPLGEGEFARFVVLATPQVRIAGRTFNPVGRLSNGELVLRLQAEYTGLEDIRKVGDRTVRVLGTDATVSKFAATAKIGSGQEVTVSIHVAKVAHDGDFVLAVAVYPRRIARVEEPRVNALLGGIAH